MRHRAINPDNFKNDLIEATPGATSSEVHGESSMLANRLERDLVASRTSDGKVASMLIDKRLLSVDEVRAYAHLAKKSGRHFVLFDVDAPLEQSLAGVLEREPGGKDPLPPFNIVSEGFTAVRKQRQAVYELFQDPSLGSYHLYATRADGTRIEVQTIDGGKETILDADLFAQTTSSGELALATERLTHDSISAVTKSLPSDRAQKIRDILQSYEGWTWKSALDAHSKEKQR
jgi:hypothetical protein